MASITPRTFGQVIRERRRKLDLTQQDLARRSKFHALRRASGEPARHPSDKVVVKLRRRWHWTRVNCSSWPTLGPRTCFEDQRISGASAWDGFVKDENLRKVHDITDQEMQTLSQVAMMGEARSSRDFIFIFNTIRQAFGQ